MYNINNLSLRIVRQMRRGLGTWCTNSYMSDKTSSRCPLDASTGRSMVEILGVLAIIGVLSVGAISGYSKAMFKYKLNKHTEQMTTIFNAITRNAKSFNNMQRGTILTSYLIKMGEIPTEMVKSNDNNFVYDIFGQGWYIAMDYNLIYLAPYSEDGSSFLFSNSPNSLATCQNILTIAKEHHDNISQVLTTTGVYDFQLIGDKLCTSEYGYNPKYCLKNLTLDTIYANCVEFAKRGNAQLLIAWDTK